MLLQAPGHWTGLPMEPPMPVFPRSRSTRDILVVVVAFVVGCCAPSCTAPRAAGAEEPAIEAPQGAASPAAAPSSRPAAARPGARRVARPRSNQPRATAPAAAPLALVYLQVGMCEACSESLAALLVKAGYRTRLVRPDEVGAPDLFAGASLYAQPGGDSTLQVYSAIGAAAWPDFAKRVRAFVAGGGHYLGICLGGWLAGPWVDEDIPAFDLLQGEVEPFTHTRGDPTVDQVVPITWLQPQQQRSVFFQEGPYFRAKGTVYARYDDGSTAALVTSYGKGRVAVSGVHLEAEADWTDGDDLRDPDGPDLDLGVLLIRALVGR